MYHLTIRPFFLLAVLAAVPPAVAQSGGNPLAGAVRINLHECLREEPDAYRQTDFRALVPCTLRGARVLDTAAVVRLLDSVRPPWLIDVMPSPRKPASLAADALWLPLPRDNLPDSVWLPNTGFGTLPREEEAYLRRNLERLRSSAPDRALLFYCERSCWMSWNAARRAIEWGYEDVYWYPEGTDGWRESGHSLHAAQPEPRG